MTRVSQGDTKRTRESSCSRFAVCPGQSSSGGCPFSFWERMKKNANRKSDASKRSGSGSDSAVISPTAADRIGEFLRQRKSGSGLRAAIGAKSKSGRAIRDAATEIGGSGVSDVGKSVGDSNAVGADSGNSGDRTGTGTGAGDGRGDGDTGTGTDARKRAAGKRADTGTGTDTPAAEMGEIPIRVKPSGKKTKTKTEQRSEAKFQAAIMTGLLQVFLTGGFQAISIFRREAHWQLTARESQALSEQLQTCLETLPKGTYDELEKLIGKYIPWVGLALTAGAIVAPRIEQSRVDRSTTTPASGGTRSRGENAGEWEFAYSNPYRAGGKSDPVSNSATERRAN